MSSEPKEELRIDGDSCPHPYPYPPVDYQGLGSHWPEGIATETGGASWAQACQQRCVRAWGTQRWALPMTTSVVRCHPPQSVEYAHGAPSRPSPGSQKGTEAIEKASLEA